MYFIGCLRWKGKPVVLVIHDNGNDKGGHFKNDEQDEVPLSVGGLLFFGGDHKSRYENSEVFGYEFSKEKDWVD